MQKVNENHVKMITDACIFWPNYLWSRLFIESSKWIFGQKKGMNEVLQKIRRAYQKTSLIFWNYIYIGICLHKNQNWRIKIDVHFFTSNIHGWRLFHIGEISWNYWFERFQRNYMADIKTSHVFDNYIHIETIQSKKPRSRLRIDVNFSTLKKCAPYENEA